jgi:hypothetical protein
MENKPLTEEDVRRIAKEEVDKAIKDFSEALAAAFNLNRTFIHDGAKKLLDEHNKKLRGDKQE